MISTFQILTLVFLRYFKAYSQSLEYTLIMKKVLPLLKKEKQQISLLLWLKLYVKQKTHSCIE